jgi:hypothetical protein
MKGAAQVIHACAVPSRPEFYIIDQVETRITCRPPAALMAQRWVWPGHAVG